MYKLKQMKLKHGLIEAFYIIRPGNGLSSYRASRAHTENVNCGSTAQWQYRHQRHDNKRQGD